MVFSGISNVSFHPLLDKLSFLLGQEPGIGSAFGKRQHGDRAKKQRNASFDNEQPPPSFKAVPCAHQLDPVRNEATESSGDSRGSVEGRDSFPLAVAGIGRREQEGQGWEKACFQETE